MNFVEHFERRFDYRVQVLRTDGGEEYANIDLFCERTGIARQRTEAENPSSNGKAERMHRTVLHMADSQGKILFTVKRKLTTLIQDLFVTKTFFVVFLLSIVRFFNIHMSNHLTNKQHQILIQYNHLISSIGY